jgi:hypothetical protein
MPERATLTFELIGAVTDESFGTMQVPCREIVVSVPRRSTASEKGTMSISDRKA